MRAIVLVGGEGTRLRPLTWRTPKQLVPVLNRPLLDHLLLHLRAHGVDRVTLAMTRRSDLIQRAYEDGRRLGIALDYAYEETPLGSGGAISSIAQGWDEPFIVCNGDIITDLDLSAMWRSHQERGAVLSISLFEVEDPSAFGVADLAEGFRIKRFVEKPKREDAPSHLINSGTWIFDPSLIAQMDPTTFHRVEERLFPDLCNAGKPVFGFDHSGGYWGDIGNPTALLRVNLDLVLGAIPARLVGVPVTHGVLVDPTATIEDGARIEGPAVVGAGTVVARGARVTRSVLWDGVRIGADAAVTGSTVATGACIEAGATVEDSVVAHDAVVPGGTTVRGASVEPGATFGGTAA
ncbi:MAG: NDP-sugar synthase [Dehalococcoidia bacterium]|nr:MAG: NDP-sugar synthase [Dehalococcoidia bacterium]